MLAEARAAPWWLIWSVPTAGGVLVGLGLHYLTTNRRTGGVPDVIEARAVAGHHPAAARRDRVGGPRRAVARRGRERGARGAARPPWRDAVGRDHPPLRSARRRPAHAAGLRRGGGRVGLVQRAHRGRAVRARGGAGPLREPRLRAHRHLVHPRSPGVAPVVRRGRGLRRARLRHHVLPGVPGLRAAGRRRRVRGDRVSVRAVLGRRSRAPHAAARLAHAARGRLPGRRHRRVLPRGAGGGLLDGGRRAARAHRARRAGRPRRAQDAGDRNIARLSLRRRHLLALALSGRRHRGGLRRGGDGRGAAIRLGGRALRAAGHGSGGGRGAGRAHLDGRDRVRADGRLRAVDCLVVVGRHRARHQPRHPRPFLLPVAAGGARPVHPVRPAPHDRPQREGDGLHAPAPRRRAPGRAPAPSARASSPPTRWSAPCAPSTRAARRCCRWWTRPTRPASSAGAASSARSTATTRRSSRRARRSIVSSWFLARRGRGRIPRRVRYLFAP